MITLYDRLNEDDRFTLINNELTSHYIDVYFKTNNRVSDIPFSVVSHVWWVLTGSNNIDTYKFWRLFDNYTTPSYFITFWSELDPLLLDKFMHTQFNRYKSLSYNNKKLKKWLE